MDMEDAGDPIALFDDWFAAADNSQREANAMALATATPDGLPSVRMVLLKAHDARGFVFYTNLTSRKGEELQVNPRAALAFHWLLPEHRQIRVEGGIEPVSAAEADAYYRSRPIDSRLGAWASQQSRPLDSRATLERRVNEMAARFKDGEIPRPEYWSGFRLSPHSFEFWQERPFRLHDRIKFETADTGWQKQRLYP